jgi:molecular chaperone GrpE
MTIMSEDMTKTPPAPSAACDVQEPAAKPPESERVEELETVKAQLAQAQQQIAALKDQHLRTLAELDNVRKRAQRELETGLKYAAERLLGELLAVCDSLELGLQAAAQVGTTPAQLGQGMALTHKQLLDFLERQGVRPIDPTGQPFDPALHEAVAAQPSAEVAPNHVLSVMQKGYRLHERLLRPARVVVARAPDPVSGAGAA